MRVSLQSPRDVLSKVANANLSSLDDRKKQVIGWMCRYFLNLPNPKTQRPLMLDIGDRALELRDADLYEFAFGLTEVAQGVMTSVVSGSRVWDPAEGPLEIWFNRGVRVVDVEPMQEIPFNQAEIVGQLVALKALKYGEIEGKGIAIPLSLLLD